MTRTDHFFLVALGTLFLAGCGRSNGHQRPPSDRSDSQQGQPTARTALIQALVASGDAAPEGDRHFAYQMALRYAPNDSSIKDKLSGPTNFNASNEELKQMQSAIFDSHSDDYGNWPEPTAEMESTELRILVDRKLVGNLRSSSASIQGKTALLMLHAPQRTVADVLSEYGTPSADQTRGDIRILTYGRIRLLGNAAGEVQTVLVKPQ